MRGKTDDIAPIIDHAGTGTASANVNANIMGLGIARHVDETKNKMLVDSEKTDKCGSNNKFSIQD